MRELIQAILSTDIHEAEEKFPSELDKLGWELFGLKPCGCGNQRIEIYMKLYKQGFQKLEEMENIKQNRTAKLKDNVVLNIPQMGITWTNASNDFTDEKAIAVLAKYKAMESRFEILPKGYGAEKKKRATKAKPKPIKEEKAPEVIEVEEKKEEKQ